MNGTRKLFELMNLNSFLYYHRKALPVYGKASKESMTGEYKRFGVKIDGTPLTQEEYDRIINLGDAGFKEHLLSQLAFIGITDEDDQEWMLQNASLNGPIGNCITNFQHALLFVLADSDMTFQQEQARSGYDIVAQDDGSYLLKARIVLQKLVEIDAIGTGISQYSQTDHHGKPIENEPVGYLSISMKIDRGDDGKFKATLESDMLTVYHPALIERAECIQAKITDYHQLLTFMDNVIVSIENHLLRNRELLIGPQENIPEYLLLLQRFGQEVMQHREICRENVDKIFAREPLFDPKHEGENLYRFLYELQQRLPVNIRKILSDTLADNERDYAFPNHAVLAAKGILAPRSSRLLDVDFYGGDLSQMGLFSENSDLYVQEFQDHGRDYLLTAHKHELPDDLSFFKPASAGKHETVVFVDVPSTQSQEVVAAVQEKNKSARVLMAKSSDNLETLQARLMAKVLHINVIAEDLAAVHPELRHNQSLALYMQNGEQLYHVILHGYECTDVAALEKIDFPVADMAIVNTTQTAIVDEVFDISLSKNEGAIVYACQAGISGSHDQFQQLSSDAVNINSAWSGIMAHVNQLAQQPAHKAYSLVPHGVKKQGARAQRQRSNSLPDALTYASLNAAYEQLTVTLTDDVTRRLRFDLAVSDFVTFTDGKWSDKRTSVAKGSWSLHFNIHPDDMEQAWNEVLYPMLSQYADYFKAARPTQVQDTMTQFQARLSCLSEQIEGLPQLECKDEAEREQMRASLESAMRAVTVKISECQRVLDGQQVTLYMLPDETVRYQQLVYMIEAELHARGIRSAIGDPAERRLGAYTSLHSPSVNDNYIDGVTLSYQDLNELMNPFKSSKDIVTNTYKALAECAMPSASWVDAIRTSWRAADPIPELAKHFTELLNNVRIDLAILGIIYGVLAQSNKPELTKCIARHLGLDETDMGVVAATSVVKGTIMSELNTHYPEDELAAAWETFEIQSQAIVDDVVQGSVLSSSESLRMKLMSFEQYADNILRRPPRPS